MNNDFRQRVFLPIILPLGVIVGFFGFAWMLSRVLLAVEESASTAIALGLALYLLALAAIISARPRITSRALTVGVALGLVALVAAGLIASAVGMRELEHAAAGEEAHGAEGEGAEGAPAGEEGSEPAGEGTAEGGGTEFVAVDVEFESAPASLPAGETEIVLVNNGETTHNVTIPQISDTPIVEADGGDTQTATATLEPGTYEYFCSVIGHEASMKGELTVEQ